jgi:hypothetical protein
MSKEPSQSASIPNQGQVEKHASPKNYPLTQSSDEIEGIDLSEVDLIPILGAVEALLVDAAQLADCMDDGVSENGEGFLFRVVTRWLDLEAILITAGLLGDAPVLIPEEWPEQDHPRWRAFQSLCSLVEVVRSQSDWRKHLPDQPNSDITPLSIHPMTSMGVRHVVFAKRVARIVELLQEVAALCPPPRVKMTKDDANQKAISLATANPSFLKMTLRGWAAAIGCSTGLVTKLPLWQATIKKTGRGRSGRTPAPKTVSFTPALEATIGTRDDSDDERLKQLVEEQRADYEPSPLDVDPPNSKLKAVKSRKRG